LIELECLLLQLAHCGRLPRSRVPHPLFVRCLQARPLAVMVNGTWPQGHLWTQAGQHHRDAGPLSLAAEVFRQRISEELTMFSVVSVLLAGMTFAPIVTPFDANIQNGPVLDCFVVSCYLGLVLSVLLTGMYTRLATALRYCPGSVAALGIRRVVEAYSKRRFVNQ
jgi:hypothetical protein